MQLQAGCCCAISMSDAIPFSPFALARGRAPPADRAPCRAPAGPVGYRTVGGGTKRGRGRRTRPRVLHRRLALGRRRAHDERQLDLLDDPVEEQVALCGAKLLRVLLGVGQLPELGLELVAHRPFDGRHPRLLQDGREARARFHTYALRVIRQRSHRMDPHLSRTAIQRPYSEHHRSRRVGLDKHAG